MGGPDQCLIADLKIPLYRALAKHVTSTHCEAIDEYSIVLRVDGSLDKFGEEGLARLRYAKARRYITVDVQIPKTVWQPMDRAQTRVYLADKVKVAIAACVDRLAREKCVVSKKRLQTQIDNALAEYLAAKDDG